ncbi:MAG: glycosyltransferase [Bifidobacteriaceae bacterium]|jgi:glycosyltransferase involved in cell wall biosynthesis|nr:glycosyltransferase [Bifidobacteriaceae bacterium]
MLKPQIKSKKIVFIGPNFYAIGGVEEATISLAEALVKLGHNVTLLSIKQAGDRVFPKGVKVLRFYLEDDKSFRGKLKLKLHRSNKWYKELLVDSYIRNLLQPYGLYRLKKWLAKNKADAVVTVRESFHPILYKCQNKELVNKLYYFHIRPDTTKTVVPIIDKVLQNYKLENALFITESVRQFVKNNLGYDNYQAYTIMGNTISVKGIIDRQQIKVISKGHVLQGCILTRFSPGKEKDLANIINGAKYIKAKAAKKIIINVYGSGSLKKSFEQEVIKQKLTDILHFHPTAPTSYEAIANCDFVIDFSNEQGFGMVYIESILQGKPVLATKNTGSQEVLRGLENYIYNNHSDMLNKILALPDLTKSNLQQAYDIIYKKYSPEVVAKRFLDIFADKI